MQSGTKRLFFALLRLCDFAPSRDNIRLYRRGLCGQTHRPLRVPEQEQSEQQEQEQRVSGSGFHVFHGARFPTRNAGRGQPFRAEVEKWRRLFAAALVRPAGHITTAPAPGFVPGPGLLAFYDFPLVTTLLLG